MRQDARALLEKLKQTEFEYREFDTDALDDAETWPLLDAVRQHPLIAKRVPNRAWPERPSTVEPIRDPAAQPGARLFGRYDAVKPDAEAAPPADQPSLSSLLRRLSDDG